MNIILNVGFLLFCIFSFWFYYLCVCQRNSVHERVRALCLSVWVM